MFLGYLYYILCYDGSLVGHRVARFVQYEVPVVLLAFLVRPDRSGSPDVLHMVHRQDFVLPRSPTSCHTVHHGLLVLPPLEAELNVIVKIRSHFFKKEMN